MLNCDIRAYGAVGDGVTLNTKAIQAAIDDCSAHGGGRVTITEGERVVVFDKVTGGKREEGVITPGSVAYYNVDDSGTRTLTYTIEAYGIGKRLVKTETMVVTKAKISRLTLIFIPGTLGLDVSMDQEDIFVELGIEITDKNVIQDDGFELFCFFVSQFR